MLQEESALFPGAHQRRRSLIEAELVANDADTTDVDREDDAAREHAEQQRLQKSEARRDQHDGNNHEPIEQGKGAATEQAPVPNQPSRELEQQAAEHEARDV